MTPHAATGEVLLPVDPDGKNCGGGDGRDGLDQQFLGD